VALNRPRVRRLLLVAPPPALLDADSLSRFRGRVLVVVGSQDSFAPTAELAERLGSDARRRLEVIPGADHFFASGLADVSRLAREWLLA
jgi:pimeloyl-ACP methyl ester carboxylesterase